jgi:CheY-like chemotaxis protein
MRMNAQTRILLVEDNQLNQEIAASFLEEAGFTCSIADNGQVALDLLRHGNFDLVLMDVEMPVLGGIATVMRMRELLINIPVIALSAHDSPAEQQKCIAAGMNACIQKPFEKEELYAVIRRELNMAFLPGAESISGGADTSAFAGEVTDLAYLTHISKGRQDFFYLMIDIFLEQNATDMVTLGTAVDNSDYETIRLLSHKIKTSITFIGLEKHILTRLVEMEELGQQKKDPARIRVLFKYVDAVCAKAVEELITVKAKRTEQ